MAKKLYFEGGGYNQNILWLLVRLRWDESLVEIDVSSDGFHFILSDKRTKFVVDEYFILLEDAVEKLMEVY